MSDAAPQRVVLFIDAQNVYKGARRAFFSQLDPSCFGQVNPIALGQFLCERGPKDIARRLAQVRIYTGRPESSKEPKTYAAHRKQCSAWERQGALVIPRLLRYPPSWPREKAEEKGIDVALAVDYIALAMDGAYDVGIIASTDTDLKPALEFVRSHLKGKCFSEVMAWRSETSRQRLSIEAHGAKLWCHWLDRADYDRVADPTDYNL